MRTNKSKLKVRAINLASLREPADLYAFFKSFKATHYVYAFICRGTVIKYGESTSQSRDTIFGERVVRQASNITTGWGDDYTLRKSSNGITMRDLCEAYEAKYGLVVNRKDVDIIVYDMSEYPFDDPDNPAAEVKKLEAEMLDDFKLQHGSLPIGNVKPERANLHIKKTPPAIIKKLFNGT
jgi:hypothetical protein